MAPGILEKGILLRARFELDQYLNLRPVVESAARALGMDVLSVRNHGHGLREASAVWVLASAGPSPVLAAIRARHLELPPVAPVRPWTDNWSDLLSAIKR